MFIDWMLLQVSMGERFGNEFWVNESTSPAQKRKKRLPDSMGKCSHCRKHGHNITTCPTKPNTGPTLCEHMVAIGATECWQCDAEKFCEHCETKGHQTRFCPELNKSE